MKRIALCLLSVCLLLSLTACQKHTSDKELMSIGLDLIATMNEMVHSDDYLALLGTSETQKMADAAKTEDGAKPAAVYRITMPSAEKLLESALYIDTEENDAWNRLSDNLKEQIKEKTGVSFLISHLNSYYGGLTQVAASSIYLATDYNDDIVVEEAVIFLYAFENGTPIAVTFTEYGQINGQFVFLEDATSLEAVQKVFEEYHCTVEQVK